MRGIEGKSRKIARFEAGRNENPVPFTTPTLTMARRSEIAIERLDATEERSPAVTAGKGFNRNGRRHLPRPIKRR